MPRPKKGSWPRSYSEAEKIALVTEIERRFQAGEGTLRAIAKQLGTCEASYYNWTKAGIKADRPRVKTYGPADRERLLVEVARLEASGLSTTAACRAAEISIHSLRRWYAAGDGEPSLRPVEVTALVPVLAPQPAAPCQTALCLLAPGGYRLEGLTIESAVALLRALA